MAYRQIYYIGNDQGILAELRNFYCRFDLANSEDAYFVQRQAITIPETPGGDEFELPGAYGLSESWNEAIFSSFMSYCPELVYVDFSGLLDHEKELVFLTEAVMTFKLHPIFMKVPFIALFDNKGEVNELSYLYSNGITGGYLKGYDNLKMMQDTSYIAFGHLPENLGEKNSGLKFNHAIKAVGNLTGIYSDCVIFETNVDLDEDQNFGEPKFIEVDLGISSVFFGKIFLYDGKVANSFKYNFAHSYKLSVPPEDKDNKAGDNEKNKNIINKAMIRKWVEVNKDIFAKKMGSILVVGNDLDDLYAASEYRKKSNYYLTFVGHLDAEFRMVEELRPSIIAIQVIEEEDDDDSESKINDWQEEYLPNNLNTIFSLVQMVQKIEDYKPMIMIFNNQSTTEAFQKTFRYNNLYSIPYSINTSFFNNLIGVYKKSYQDKFKSTKLELPTIDSRRFSLIKQIVEITCINEHGITFLSKYKYPDYSLIKIEVPCQIFFILVPPMFSLNQAEGKKHHMALYCGIRPLDWKRFWEYFDKSNPGMMQELDFKISEVPIQNNETETSQQEQPEN